MADDHQWLLKEEGYLNVDTESRRIIYHPNLNVILIFTKQKNEVIVLDVNTGVILQSCVLTKDTKISGLYLSEQDKVLFWDGKNLGMRGDYNGVLLLDTILQTPVFHSDDTIKIELLLSEASQFLQSLKSLEEHGVENTSDVINELTEKIAEAQSNTRKGIKAQKWNVVCLTLSHTSLKSVASNVVYQLKRLDRHIPALAISSAINERLTDLLMGLRILDSLNAGNSQRYLMYSEAARRQTFDRWPHMDYKWALPDQMAQAGFYHQPSSNGDDRAMCFTCNVCLVCWEKTDEPWSEHERHSPMCPFVKGEYTPNVPLSITYATNPAVATLGFQLISSGTGDNFICTASRLGEITIWDIQRQLTKAHTLLLKEAYSFLNNAFSSISKHVEYRLDALCTLSIKRDDNQSSHSGDDESGGDVQRYPNNRCNNKLICGISKFDCPEDNDEIEVDSFNLVLLVYDIKFQSQTPIDSGQKILAVSGNQNKSNGGKKDTGLKDTSNNITLVKAIPEDQQNNFYWHTSKLKLEKSKIGDAIYEMSTADTEGSKLISTEELNVSTIKINNFPHVATQNSKVSVKESSISASVTPTEKVICEPSQCVIINSYMFSSSEITDIILSFDKKHLLIVIKEICNTKQSDNVTADEVGDHKMDVDSDDNSGIESKLDKNSKQDCRNAQLIVYEIDEKGIINPEPISIRVLFEDYAPMEITMLPTTDNNGKPLGGNDTKSGVFAMVCADGSLKLVSLANLKTISETAIEENKFVSAVYCKTLDRLCACTQKGSLHFYSFFDVDADSSDEREDDQMGFIVSDASLTDCEHEVSETDGSIPRSSLGVGDSIPLISGSRNKSPSENPSPSSSGTTLLANKTNLTLNDLKTLYSLTLFDESLTPFAAEVPSCWSELIQAQKQRRHPTSGKVNEDNHLTKTWRLHNDTTTADEHLIELNLQKPINLGHVDFKFSLYSQSSNVPAIQVTLLKQKTNGFGCRLRGNNIQKDDENMYKSETSSQSANNSKAQMNPVLSEEYLNAHNAEIVAGPIDLSSCMDLSELSGTAILTSPKLFRVKGRNFLLHIKTMIDPAKDGQAKTRVPVSKRGILRYLFPSFANNTAQSSVIGTQSKDSGIKRFRKNDNYIGCDWLHEISITIRSTKSTKITNERTQRCAMLESNSLLINLLQIAISSPIGIFQNISLDILIWIASIRLSRFRSPQKTDMKSTKRESNTNDIGGVYAYQVACVNLIKSYLLKLILNCILRGNRTTAHKCVKLIMIAFEGARNISPSAKEESDASLETFFIKSVAHCLPEIINTKHAGALKWFTLLTTGFAAYDTTGKIPQKCVASLLEVAHELNKRKGPHCALLRTRFGLYGMPFEPDLYDIDIPLNSKSNSLATTLAALIKNAVSTQKNISVDLKKLCSSESSEFKALPSQIRRKAVCNQLKGLLEVEALHFVCCGSSEATRLENIDSNSSANVFEDIMFDSVHSNMEPLKSDGDTECTLNNLKNALTHKMFTSAMKKHNAKDSDNSFSTAFPLAPYYSVNSDNNKGIQFTAQTMKGLYGVESDILFHQSSDSGTKNCEKNDKKKLKKLKNEKIEDIIVTEKVIEDNTVLQWHKLLSPPPKQMMVVDRMHSGARRYVTLDFGSPIMLTDMMIPACEDLFSLFIDIWCFDEEADSMRLVAANDIGFKSLVLSDLQPPPICRYMKITTTGRYGMSAATRCKIPLGTFYGHVIVLEADGYADPLMKYVRNRSTNIPAQLKALNCLYEDVHCRYSLSSAKLEELITPMLSSEISNIAHMQAYLNKNKESEDTNAEQTKIVNIYEECITFQHQLNIIRSVINRLEAASVGQTHNVNFNIEPSGNLSRLSFDKLRVLSENLVEILLHFVMENEVNTSLNNLFDLSTCDLLFNTLVITGDTHMQLATCSLLVRMCCFQSWWGEFLGRTFKRYYSSQNCTIFPQDRVFFLLTYLGRRSIAMGTSRSIVVDSILKILAELLVPLSPMQRSSQNMSPGIDEFQSDFSSWSKTDLQLISWLLLFLSVCLDDTSDKKSSSNRWDFMSGEVDLSKARTPHGISGCKAFTRTFKKRFLTSKQNGNLTPDIIPSEKQSETSLKRTEEYHDIKTSKAFRILYDDSFTLEKYDKLKSTFEVVSSAANKIIKDSQQSSDTPSLAKQAEVNVKTLKTENTLVVIRGLLSLLLAMDFTCNVDLFLLTSKIIGKLMSACRPYIQLSKVITVSQLKRLIRMGIWQDQQQPWTVHAITCLLQDILDADKCFKLEEMVQSISQMEDINETTEFSTSASNDYPEPAEPSSYVIKDLSYADSVKFNYLPSLTECDDAEMDDLIDNILERGKTLVRKEQSFTYLGLPQSYCSISSAMDARLEHGLETNIEIMLRRLTLFSSLNLFVCLPQVLSETVCINHEIQPWPEHLTNAWSHPEYNQGYASSGMLSKVFDEIFSELHIQDTWMNIDQVLQLWLTLNGEISEKKFDVNASASSLYIPFGLDAIEGLLEVLIWKQGITLRTWSLAFQCLKVVCHTNNRLEKTIEPITGFSSNCMIVHILSNPNFGKMLIRFFSLTENRGNSGDTCRFVGPTICKLLHDIRLKMELMSGESDHDYVQNKLKETFLYVVLELLQPNGAIANKQGPLDAQIQLVNDMIDFPYYKSDLHVAMKIIECVAHITYDHSVNVDQIHCHRLPDINTSNNMFNGLFASVLGSDTNKPNKSVSESRLLFNLLKLTSTFIIVPVELTQIITDDWNYLADVTSSSNEFDEKQMDQQSSSTSTSKVTEKMSKIPFIADNVLRHQSTMNRLLGTLSHSTISSFGLLSSSCMLQTSLDVNIGVPDAVLNLLMLLFKHAQDNSYIVEQLYNFLLSKSNLAHALPKLHLSGPFSCFILKVLESADNLAAFTRMGGINVLCQSLVRCNRSVINTQPGLISMIMQFLNESPKYRGNSNNGNGSKKQSLIKPENGLFNFAPFCSIMSDNSTAQSPDVLLYVPVASHRRARTPTWSYLFYPGEAYVDLSITLPTAILLSEIQLQPHLPSLASCPSAIAVEIGRDNSKYSTIPLSRPMATVGLTCIKLKLAQPEIATNILLRLYRPRDSSNVGLTQIFILGTTTFMEKPKYDGIVEDDAMVKSSLGWLGILSRCFSVASYSSDTTLSNLVVSAAANYPGFLEACCSLLNISGPAQDIASQNLEHVLLKLGLLSKDFGMRLIDNLLNNTTPQNFCYSNESVADQLYELCTTQDNYTRDRITAVINWIQNLYNVYKSFDKNMQSTNPHSGFVRCLASILWTTCSTNLIDDLPSLITKELFDSVFQWTKVLNPDDPMKKAIDTLLCSMCCIKPCMFPLLLDKMDILSENRQIKVPRHELAAVESTSSFSFADELEQNILINIEFTLKGPNELFLTSAQLDTIAIACQSPLVVQQMLKSGLPAALSGIILEYCMDHAAKEKEDDKVFEPMEEDTISTSSSSRHSSISISSDSVPISGESVNTSRAQSENSRQQRSKTCLMANIQTITEILNFFSEVCAEGQMRDWLGSQEGSLFWKPLLDLLCHQKPDNQSRKAHSNFTQLENAVLKFLSRVTSCHPRNQERLTVILIAVIKKPNRKISANRIISGFTRRLVLQLLLESERILVSVRSEFPLQRKEHTNSVLSNHPSKRPNAHHLLFVFSTHTKCQEILDNCVSAYNSLVSYPNVTADISNDTANAADDIMSVVFPASNTNVSVNERKEFLSLAAGFVSRDKRLKEAKNQAAAMKVKDLLPILKLQSDENSQAEKSIQLIHTECPDLILNSETTISQILAALKDSNISLSTPCISLNLVSTSSSEEECSDSRKRKANEFEPLPSPLQIFSSRGGLSLLAHYLPTVYPDNPKTPLQQTEKEKNTLINEWVKVEPNDDVYEDLDSSYNEISTKTVTISSVPQHSLAAFGLFLRLPQYSEVLLQDKLKAQCLLRLVLGVTGDGEGNEIYSLSLAPSLPTLPFEVFRMLLDLSPLTSEDGVRLRQMTIEVGAMHLVLNCLGVFTHHSQHYLGTGVSSDVMNANVVKLPASAEETTGSNDDKNHAYWAKGTGFGTGSTQQSWDVEQALLRQKSEEEHVTVLLKVLSAYINPNDNSILTSNVTGEDQEYNLDDTNVNPKLPDLFLSMLKQSCLIPALSSYLRNDSVLDITRHIPLYRAILKLLRALALSIQLVSLLSPQNRDDASASIAALLSNMKTCVDTYANRLKVNKKSNLKGTHGGLTLVLNFDDGEDEGLALLIPDIQETAVLVQNATANEMEMNVTEEDNLSVQRPISKSIEERYLEVMKKLQFDAYEMIVESENGYRFTVSYHFENNVRIAGERGHPARIKRLAQETVTLSTSLPLSYSSSVFVRCDNDRLDVMKVLITGPAETPYANGCFEFDVYFPPDYPNSPMLINLETTGRHTVRFNPNLYNDGKVCLSVLNTWHGRPEEKWNAQTSSFLQVLVSIQSLILVPEPYFNEPGFERSRGTACGNHSSREYNSNIYQACVRWAMLEQIKNPSPCFKDVIHTHFWLKRQEICNQIEEWITELNKPKYNERCGRTISFNSTLLRRQYRQLREELAKLPTPEGLEDLENTFQVNMSSPSLSLDVPTPSTAVHPGISSATTPAVIQPDGMEDTSMSSAVFDSNNSSDSNMANAQDPLVISIHEII